MLAEFSGLNPKGPYLSLEKEKEIFCVVLTYSIKRASEIRKLHIAVEQKRLRECAKKSDARAKLFFCKSKAIAFLLLQKLPSVVIQKFCYHSNVTSNFSSVFIAIQDWSSRMRNLRLIAVSKVSCAGEHFTCERARQTREGQEERKGRFRCLPRAFFSLART